MIRRMLPIWVGLLVYFSHVPMVFAQDSEGPKHKLHFNMSFEDKEERLKASLSNNILLPLGEEIEVGRVKDLSVVLHATETEDGNLFFTTKIITSKGEEYESHVVTRTQRGVSVHYRGEHVRYHLSLKTKPLGQPVGAGQNDRGRNGSVGTIPRAPDSGP